MLHELGPVAATHAAQHLALVLLGAGLVLLGSSMSVALLGRAAQTTGWSRSGWLLLCGLETGAFAWCTHVILLAASWNGAPLSFNLSLALGSLVLGILCCGLAATLAVQPWPAAAPLGGAGIGLGIGLMQPVIMAAFAGALRWAIDPTLFVVSLLAGAVCGAMGVHAALRVRRPWQAATAIFFLAAAVLGMQALNIAAASIAMPGGPVDHTLHGKLAVAVGAACLLVLAATAAAWMIDHRNRADSGNRLRSLADSAMDGLAIVQAGHIAEANDTLHAMLGRQDVSLRGMAFPGDLLVLRDGDTVPQQHGWLQRADGSALEVVVLMREDVPAPGLRAYALRDLREQREQERRILHVTTHDALTGLANRAYFAQQMDQVLRQALRQDVVPSFALLHLGLDHFKHINDLHGHAGGDALLRSIGQRLRLMLGGEGLAARLAGDEYGLLLPCSSELEVLDLISRVERAVGGANGIDGHELIVTACTGVALFPTDARAGETLRSHAELAMRRAKASAIRGLRFYHPEMDVAERLRLDQIQALRVALATRQFRLYAQVQLDVRTGQPCGHEMLLRWQHPTRGLVAPTDFIPLAEECGMILPIGTWVLEEACALAAAYPDLGKVAVNLSAMQFSQPDLPQQVARALAASSLPPGRLELEITETSLMLDRERTLPLLERIKALGVKVAMDDFGTGYSSLATLRAFPFDKIKLDRSFMTGVETSRQAVAILRAVIGIGRGLEIPVLAEGVETAAQFALLQAEGCDEVQGYLFGRPEPVQGEPVVRV